MLRLRYSGRRSVALALIALAAALVARGQQPPPTVEDPLKAAKAALRQSQWAEAEKLLRNYTREHENSAEARYLLGFALFRENHPQQSLDEYTHAAKLQPPSAFDFKSIALDYVLLNDYTDADKWMTKSLGLDANDGEGWYSLGRIKYTENRFAEAEESFKKALGFMPKSVKVEDNLGLVYEGLNQPEAAIAAYRQAISWQSESAQKSEQPLLNLGILLSDQDQLDQALPLLQEAESIAPKDSKIHAALGKLYRKRADLAHAQSELERAVALDPKSAGLHFQLGQVYRKQGQTNRAATEFARAAELDGTHSSPENH